MMLKASLSVLVLALCTLVEAGTVRLVNDSPYKLRAVVRGNDGSFLGEVVINPQDTSTWTDGFQGLAPGFNTTKTQTPYTVLWYCLEGDAFGTCPNIGSGGMAIAQRCDGSKQCRPAKQRQPEGEIPPPPLPVPDYQGPGPQEY